MQFPALMLNHDSLESQETARQESATLAPTTTFTASTIVLYQPACPALVLMSNFTNQVSSMNQWHDWLTGIYITRLLKRVWPISYVCKSADQVKIKDKKKYWYLSLYYIDWLALVVYWRKLNFYKTACSWMDYRETEQHMSACLETQIMSLNFLAFKPLVSSHNLTSAFQLKKKERNHSRILFQFQRVFVNHGRREPEWSNT